jgi:oxygen-independent coproporphyrinogen-3 oxidase
VERERLEGRAARGEAALLALRMNEGLDLAAWQSAHGQSLDAEFGEALRKPRQAGCLEESGGRLRLSPRGRLLANEVFQAFL